MPSIQVSAETYQRIENRATFDDTKPEDVIRRLLDRTEPDRSSNSIQDDAADLVAKGGTIPHGTELRMNYKGREYRAIVDDGKIIWNGKAFSSPSEAATAVIQSTGKKSTRANGWEYWEVKTPASGEWRPANDLRSNGSSVEEKMEEAQRTINKLTQEQRERLQKELKAEGIL